MGGENSKDGKNSYDNGNQKNRTSISRRKGTIISREEYARRLEAERNHSANVDELSGDINKNLNLAEKVAADKQDKHFGNQASSGIADNRGAHSLNSNPVGDFEVIDNPSRASNFNAAVEKNPPNGAVQFADSSQQFMGHPLLSGQQPVYRPSVPPPNHFSSYPPNQFPNPPTFYPNQCNVTYPNYNEPNVHAFQTNRFYQNEIQNQRLSSNHNEIHPNNFHSNPYQTGFTQNTTIRPLMPPDASSSIGNQNQFRPNNQSLFQNKPNENTTNPPKLNRNQNSGNHLNTNIQNRSNTPENRNQNRSDFNQQNKRFQGKQFRSYNQDNQANRNQNYSNNPSVVERPLFRQNPPQNTGSNQTTTDQRNKQFKENKNQSNFGKLNDNQNKQTEENRVASDNQCDQQRKPTSPSESPSNRQNNQNFDNPNQHYPSNRQKMNKQGNQQQYRKNVWKRSEERSGDSNNRNFDNNNQGACANVGRERNRGQGRRNNRGRNHLSRDRQPNKDDKGDDNSTKELQAENKNYGSRDDINQNFNGRGCRFNQRGRGWKNSRGRTQSSGDRSFNEVDNKCNSNSDDELPGNESDSPSTSGESSSQGEKTKNKFVPHGINKNKNTFKNKRNKNNSDADQVKKNVKNEEEVKKPLSKNNLGVDNILLKYIGSEIPKFSDAVFYGVSLYQPVEGVLLMSDPTADDPIIKPAETLLHIIEFKDEFPKAKSYFVDKFT